MRMKATTESIPFACRPPEADRAGFVCHGRFWYADDARHAQEQCADAGHHQSDDVIYSSAVAPMTTPDIIYPARLN